MKGIDIYFYIVAFRRINDLKALPKRMKGRPNQWLHAQFHIKGTGNIRKFAERVLR